MPSPHGRSPEGRSPEEPLATFPQGACGFHGRATNAPQREAPPSDCRGLTFLLYTPAARWYLPSV